jgi:hypothetical protein
MPTNARFENAGESAGGHSPASGPRVADARRHEIMRLLEDIRSDQPTATDILDAVRRACNGELAPDRVQRIAGSVLALYR